MNFELSRNLPIGHYIPTGSFVHRLDPRTKLLSALFFFVAVSFARSLMVSLILLVALLLITRLARLPFRFILRTLLASWPILTFFLLLALLYLGWQAPAGRVYWQWGYLRFTRAALQMLALSLTRLLALLFLVSLPSLTTPITQLTHGVELLLLPLQRFGVPAVEIALVNTIALRFVPTLAEELERVMKAQASRCGAIGNLSWRRPIQIGRTLLPLMVPLFVNAFRRAEDLAIAMEARGYIGGKGRTRYIQLQSNWFDKVIVLVMLGFCLAVALAPWPALHTLLPGL